jgi:hypothetical protein
MIMPNKTTSEPTNAERRERADKILHLYKTTALREGGPVDDETVIDLLTDLRHWCQSELRQLGGAHPFDDCVNVSEIHFDAEQKEES